MTLNRPSYRPDDALLAGVCAEAARRLGWNVWAIRGLFVVGLFIHAIGTGVVYGVAAVAMGLLLGRGGSASGTEAAGEDGRLRSAPLEERGRRIEALEEKFRSLEEDR